ncbi:MAG: LamG domain-containing protein [Candidatus Aenigmatarchaeota archaeon]
MKAITPVIALVMLMLITVGSVGMAYAWFSGMLSAQTEKNIAIPVGGVQCINNRVSVIVTNAGANSNITDDDIVVADINGVSVRNTPFFGGFNVNGLVGYWRFEGDARDYSRYGSDGSLQGSPIQTDGIFGKAYNFNPADGNDYVDAGDPASGILDFGAGQDFTAEAWIKTTGVSMIILSKGSAGDAGKGYWLYVMHNGYFEAGLTDGVSPRRLAQGSTKSINNGLWHHVGAVYDRDGKLTLYVDGSYETAIDISEGDLTNSYSFQIGKLGDGGLYFNGAIDEVAIWNRALTADEITQLNKTNAGNFTIAPQKAITLINLYPVFSRGKYTVRIGTRNAVIERVVDCL